jgi:hypothetical protein
MVYRFDHTLQTEGLPAAPAHPLAGVSARHVVGWLMRDPASLSAAESQHLQHVCRQDALMEQAYHLITTFRRMLQERTGRN